LVWNHSKLQNEHQFYKLVAELPSDLRAKFPVVYQNVFRPYTNASAAGGFVVLMNDVTAAGFVHTHHTSYRESSKTVSSNLLWLVFCLL
jgi:hypothetical protein